MEAYVRYMGPMTRPFKRELQYQYEVISPGESKEVYRLENPSPDLLMGIITQVANDWYPNTYLEWLIDGEAKKIEYIIGDIKSPKEFTRGIPFERDVIWIAYNNDTTSHAFGVLCDGFFIEKHIYEKIIGFRQTGR